MQSASWGMLGWMKHKLGSRLPGEISITSDMQMTHHPYGRKWRTKKTFYEREWKSWLKTQHSETKIITSGPITAWQIDGETMADFILGGSKITSDGDCSHEIKRCLLLGRKAMTNLDSILKSRHYFANKGSSSQGCGFSSGHVWMWELDYKESSVLKNWCFWNNCGVREDSWESLGLQGDPTSPS